MLSISGAYLQLISILYTCETSLVYPWILGIVKIECVQQCREGKNYWCEVNTENVQCG